MSLKAIYESEADIPVEAQALELYEEKDGRWMLKRDAIEGVKTQADIDRITNASRKERELRSAAETKLKRFERLGDKDPDALLRLEDEVEELRLRADGGGTKDESAIQKRIDAAVAREVNPLRRDLQTVTGERDTYRQKADEMGASIRTSAIRSELTRVAGAMKVRPEAIEDLLRYENVFDIGDDGKVRTKDNAGFTPGIEVEHWMTDLKPNRSHWWPESVGGGARPGGAGGVNGANPFNLKSANITEAMRMVRTDRPKAEQYARSAGFATPEDAFKEMAKAAASPTNGAGR